MRTLLACAIAAALLCVTCCDGPRGPRIPGRIHYPAVAPQIIMLDDPFNTPFPEDPVAIESASVKGDLLTLRVAYGGGCRTHEFAIYGSNRFLESHPVQARILLSHDANGDQCEAFIRQDLVFDLSPLKQSYRQSYPGDGPVLLRITEPGTDEPIRPLPLYEF